MNIILFRKLLGWSALINYVILTLWLLAFLLFHDAIYRFHTKWFELSVSQFDFIHYVSMAIYDIAACLLFLVPWIVLLFLSRK